MVEKDPGVLSAETKRAILSNAEVTVLRKSVTNRFAPEDIEIVREALRQGDFSVGRTQTYNG